MTKEELAQSISGVDRREGIGEMFVNLAKENGLIIIYGESDDLVEFEGALYDEIGAWDGIDFIIATVGMEIPVDDDEETYTKAKELTAIEIEGHSNIKTNRFKAVWCPEGTDMSWEIKTELPNARFEIMEDGDVFGIGIVIDVKDLK